MNAERGAYWTVSSPDIPVYGYGSTPRQAMDGLACAVMTAIRMMQRPDLPSDDQSKAVLEEFVDLERPCPDPDAKRCGD